jgi:hypothetical protein
VWVKGGMREALLAAELAMAKAGGEKWIDQRIDEEWILIIERSLSLECKYKKRIVCQWLSRFYKRARPISKNPCSKYM